MNIRQFLSERFANAMQIAGIAAEHNPQIRQAAKAGFGDYQVNGIMGAAKKMSIAPRDLATKVLAEVDLEGIATKLEIAGPGFINIHLNPSWVASQLDQALISPHLDISPVTPQTVVVDYSAPNVAKQMHAGHLRSTIIGDAVVRTLEYLGHKVIRANHIGDWGTQFGMLIAELEHETDNQSGADLDLSDFEAFYRQAKQHYDADPAFAELSRNYVVRLQGGDAHCRALWKRLVNITMTQNQALYERLNVSLTMSDVMGESLYNDMLPEIVDDLLQRGIAQESDGAIVVYLDAFRTKEGEPMGVIIRKQDGGYLYATTDLACVRYRCQELHANRILYFIDSRQSQHLQMVWAIARLAGYVPEGVTLEHMMFGMMLGKDGKPFKTREGGIVRLKDLLDEAEQRARRLIADKNPEIQGAELDKLAHDVGIGAVKYADLSKNRTTDYVFDWDNMLSFEGNTAPYLQYACSRLKSIFRNAESAGITPNPSVAMVLEETQERTLGLRLLQFEECLQAVAQEGTPHLMCTYLYSLATSFSGFYEQCPILNGVADDIRDRRLQLAHLTLRTLSTGLDTLGILVPERM